VVVARGGLVWYVASDKSICEVTMAQPPLCQGASFCSNGYDGCCAGCVDSGKACASCRGRKTRIKVFSMRMAIVA